MLVVGCQIDSNANCRSPLPVVRYWLIIMCRWSGVVTIVTEFLLPVPRPAFGDKEKEFCTDHEFFMKRFFFAFC